MFMKTNVLFNTVAAVILVLALCGCREEKNRDFDRLVLNNKALEREIIEYRTREDQHPAYEGTKVYTSVWCKEINDSTVRYVLRPFSDPAELDKYPVSFICNVDGEDVFSLWAAVSQRLIIRITSLRCRRGTRLVSRKSISRRFTITGTANSVRTVIQILC